MDNENSMSWEEFLNPQILKQKLISCSIYLTAYEMLKDIIVDRIKSVYIFPFKEEDSKDIMKYDLEVLSKDPKKRPLQASLNWLSHNNVIDDHDLLIFKQLTDCRNTIAHRMQQILSNELQTNHLSLLPELIALIRKIEIWWIVTFELPANPDFDNVEIAETHVNPGIIITLQIMLDIALGDEEQANSYFKFFKENSSKL